MESAAQPVPDSQPVPAAEPDDAVQLLIRLLKLGSMVNGPMKDGVCDPEGVAQIELKVLMALAGEGALAGHDLVEIMGVPAMNVSRAIASLRTRGWIEDAIDPENRRRKPVRLTAAGEAKYASLTPALQAVAEALTGQLTQRQQREFSKLADHLVARMTEWIVGHHEGVKFHG